MLTQKIPASVAGREIDSISERFAEVFRTNEVGDVFTPDAFFDLNMPVWRFQLQGPDAFEDLLRGLNPDCVEISVARTIPTDTGFVTEHQDRKFEDGREMTSRKLLLCEVRDGQITEVVVYCSGEWDEELRARHALEAPMIRA